MPKRTNSKTSVTISQTGKHVAVSGGVPKASADVSNDALYKQLAEQKDHIGLNSLGCRLVNNKSEKIEKQRKKASLAFQCFQAAAELNNATAQRNLARCFLTGCGTDQHIDKTAEWLEKAAKNTDNDARVQWSIYCWKKRINGKDARAQIQLAAEQGNVHGQYYRGLMHLLASQAQEIDEKQQSKEKEGAKKYFALAQAQGSMGARYELAKLRYEQAEIDDAAFEALLIEVQSHPDAAFNLAMVYHKKFKLAPDQSRWFTACKELLEQGVRQRYPPSLHIVSVDLLRVNKLDSQAHKMLIEAARNGYLPSIQAVANAAELKLPSHGAIRWVEDYHGNLEKILLAIKGHCDFEEIADTKEKSSSVALRADDQKDVVKSPAAEATAPPPSPPKEETATPVKKKKKKRLAADPNLETQKQNDKGKAAGSAAPAANEQEEEPPEEEGAVSLGTMVMNTDPVGDRVLRVAGRELSPYERLAAEAAAKPKAPKPNPVTSYAEIKGALASGAQSPLTPSLQTSPSSSAPQSSPATPSPPTLRSPASSPGADVKAGFQTAVPSVAINGLQLLSALNQRKCSVPELKAALMRGDKVDLELLMSHLSKQDIDLFKQVLKQLLSMVDDQKHRPIVQIKSSFLIHLLFFENRFPQLNDPDLQIKVPTVFYPLDAIKVLEQLGFSRAGSKSSGDEKQGYRPYFVNVKCKAMGHSINHELDITLIELNGPYIPTDNLLFTKELIDVGYDSAGDRIWLSAKLPNAFWLQFEQGILEQAQTKSLQYKGAEFGHLFKWYFKFEELIKLSKVKLGPNLTKALTDSATQISYLRNLFTHSRFHFYKEFVELIKHRVLAKKMVYSLILSFIQILKEDLVGKGIIIAKVEDIANCLIVKYAQCLDTDEIKNLKAWLGNVLLETLNIKLTSSFNMTSDFSCLDIEKFLLASDGVSDRSAAPVFSAR